MRDTFLAHANRSPLQQTLFQIFLPQEAGSFGNIIKETAKTMPKIEKT